MVAEDEGANLNVNTVLRATVMVTREARSPESRAVVQILENQSDMLAAKATRIQLAAEMYAGGWVAKDGLHSKVLTHQIMTADLMAAMLFNSVRAPSVARVHLFGTWTTDEAKVPLESHAEQADGGSRHVWR